MVSWHRYVEYELIQASETNHITGYVPPPLPFNQNIQSQANLHQAMRGP